MQPLSQTLARSVWTGKPGFGCPQCSGPSRVDVAGVRSPGSVSCGAGLQQSLPKHQLPPELLHSLAGSKAPDEAVGQGPGPGDLGGALVWAAGTATDGPALLSHANLRLQRLRSCLGNHWGATVQSTEMGSTASRH